MKHTSKPLKGLRILITRPKEQSKLLAEEIARLGGTPIEFPTIGVEPTEKSVKSEMVFETLNGYHWIVFTSANGVRHFFKEATMKKTDFAPRIAVIGPATAHAVEQSGLKVSFISSPYLTERLAKELPRVERKRILLVRAEGADARMKSILTERGASVDEVHPYRVMINRPSSLLEDYDAVLFTSPSTVSSFIEIAGGSRAKSLGRIVCCIGPVTAKAVEARGFRVDVVAKEHSAQGLVGALVEKVESA